MAVVAVARTRLIAIALMSNRIEDLPGLSVMRFLSSLIARRWEEEKRNSGGCYEPRLDAWVAIKQSTISDFEANLEC
jgi:hypothetical protein